VRFTDRLIQILVTTVGLPRYRRSFGDFLE